jgi:mRNA interferase MazF
MKQGDIYWTDLNPVQGSEQAGIRPVVIVSGNAMNDNFSVVIVCPVSSKIKHLPGCVILNKDTVNNLSSDSEVITFQIRAVTKQRLKGKLGEVTQEQLKVIRRGLDDVLTY